MAKREKLTKVFKIVSNVVMYLFMAICVMLVIFSVTSKRDQDGAINFFGKQMRIVVSESMERCDQTYDEISQYDIKDIPLKSMVFISLAPEVTSESRADFDEWCKELQVGDVLTFRYTYSRQVPITHRIIEKTENAWGGYTIKLQGDNKPGLEQDADAQKDNSYEANVGTQTIDTSKIDPNFTSYYIVGKVTGQSKLLGNLVYAVKQPIGIALIVIVPCVIIVIFEIIRIITVLGSDRKKKDKEAMEKQESEIEALKRQLEELQKQSKAPTVQADSGENAPAVVETQAPETSSQVAVEQPDAQPVEEQTANTEEPMSATNQTADVQEITAAEEKPQEKQGDNPQA